MTIVSWLHFITLTIVLLITAPALGSIWACITEGKRTFLHPVFGGLERITYRIAGINPSEEMTWGQYAKSLLWFNFIGFIFLFLILSLQQYLPFNPQQMSNLSWSLALNTTVSFVTNSNWQSYPGETTLSYGSQMFGLTVQNFLSAATGSAVLMALIRGIVRKSSPTIGNYWADLVRTVVYLLLPISLILALVFVEEGVVQSLSPYVTVETLEKGTQTIPLGPAASQVAIKQLGTNGGGFFHTNSAHPFENPSAITNFLQNLAILVVPVAIVYAYGVLMKSKKQAWLPFITMFAIWSCGYAISIYSESLHNPVINAHPHMEGKETRLGISNSVLWSTATTATTSGSVNNMLESLSPLAGGVALLNMLIGELAFGGIGVGLCCMLKFVMLTVFLCGLMVGRTPEYLGKKIERREVQWITLGILLPVVLILTGAGITCLIPDALQSISSAGPHGLTELLYAFASAAGNNGSSFAGLNSNTNYYNITLAIAILGGRLSILIPALAIAGSLAMKNATPKSAGTLSTDNALFGFLLFSVIMIMCALTFIPALSLGPIIEHLLMLQGKSFPSPI